ncbi:MAG: large-conductance mechanosensitive channel protein MscL, partial [Rikenellaceae bacterium]
IGAAFGKIVSSMVGDILMPPLGALLGGVDFTSFAVTIKAATEHDPAVIISYGKFIQTIIDFIIIAFSIFMLIKFLTKMQKKKAETPVAAPTPSKEEMLLTEIRDLLKEKK